MVPYSFYFIIDSPCTKQTVCKVLNRLQSGKYLAVYLNTTKTPRLRKDTQRCAKTCKDTQRRAKTCKDMQRHAKKRKDGGTAKTPALHKDT